MKRFDRRGFLIAAPHSGSGKTVVSLGVMRAFADTGLRVAPAKAGPDYIDPAFHAASAGNPSINLDPWAMPQARLSTLVSVHGASADIVVCEAMMGLFDGAADGSASAADLAAHLGMPIVFVVDASHMAQSIAALVSGYRAYRADIKIAGVILNRVGSSRHETMLRDALERIGVAVLGAVPSRAGLALPSRHLGLVQAREHGDLEGFIDTAATLVQTHCDLDALAALQFEIEALDAVPLDPLGQRIAIARDDAFAFCYPHILQDWQRAGAELTFFSPMADEVPDRHADAVYLPGGYPELHARGLADAGNFRAAMQTAQMRGALIYGECGGYMVLGRGITDAQGHRRAMLGLLALETDFSKRKRHLGYRRLRPRDGAPWSYDLSGHEFHYSVATYEEGESLFDASDALGHDLGALGLRVGRVCGSYLHVIDRSAV